MHHAWSARTTTFWAPSHDRTCQPPWPIQMFGCSTKAIRYPSLGSRAASRGGDVGVCVQQRAGSPSRRQQHEPLVRQQSHREVSLIGQMLCAVRSDNHALCWSLPGMVLTGPPPTDFVAACQHRALNQPERVLVVVVPFGSVEWALMAKRPDPEPEGASLPSHGSVVLRRC